MYTDVIGVLGGMGSYATLHFFEALLKAFPAEKEWDRPRILIDNRCTMPSRVLAVLQGVKREQLVDELSDSVFSLLQAGATKIILACNTSHCFLTDIFERIPAAEGKILSIIDLCCRDVAAEGEKEVSLIASEGTIESGVFRKGLEPLGIAVHTPQDRQYLLQRELIEDVKQDRITKETIDTFTELICSFSGEALILGCTEFPALYDRVSLGALGQRRIYDPLQSAISALKAQCR